MKKSSKCPQCTNSNPVKKARTLNINLPQIRETCLLKLPHHKTRKDWREANKDAIADYNKRVEKDGAFSNGLRVF